MFFVKDTRVDGMDTRATEVACLRQRKRTVATEYTNTVGLVAT